MAITKGDRKTINAWTFYDWANSSYPLVISTAIFPIFFERVTSKTLPDGTLFDKVNFLGFELVNTELYSYIVSLSFLVVVLTSPVLSGIADFSGKKKRFMQFFCYLGALSTASLYFFDPNHLELSMLSVFFASLGFWGSLVFYNAYLPEIAEPQEHDRVSAQGFALGYFGSALLLILNLIAIMVFGMDSRISFITVALWWAGFAQISFARLPNSDKNGTPNRKVILNGFREISHVWKEIGNYPSLKRFLGSFFFYSMGVQTVMLMAVLFAKKEIKGLDDSSLIISVLLIQFLGVAGSYLFSFSSRFIGNIKTLGISLFLWVLICVGTYLFVYTPTGFYFVACAVGLVMGGIQALSRSTYSKLLPDTEYHASYFSFYDISEKVGIVIGMLSFGFIEGLTGGMRNSILALITFFVIGFLILLTIPKSKHVR
jgi:UMF1 family MFS transporter